MDTKGELCTWIISTVHESTSGIDLVWMNGTPLNSAEPLQTPILYCLQQKHQEKYTTYIFIGKVANVRKAKDAWL